MRRCTLGDSSLFHIRSLVFPLLRDALLFRLSVVLAVLFPRCQLRFLSSLSFLVRSSSVSRRYRDFPLSLPPRENYRGRWSLVEDTRPFNFAFRFRRPGKLFRPENVFSAEIGPRSIRALLRAYVRNERGEKERREFRAFSLCESERIAGRFV